MKKRKVVPMDALPMRAPLIATLVWWLVLDKLDAPGWVWGALGLLMVIGWIAWICDVILRDEHSPFA